MRTIIVLDMTSRRDTEFRETHRTNGASEPGPRQVLSEQLLGRANELVIVHGGRQYRLRVTQNGKLILTA